MQKRADRAVGVKHYPLISESVVVFATAQARVAQLTPSLLAKAFRGELNAE